NMAPVVTKLATLGFIPGTEATMIRVETLAKLEPDLLEAVRESAYLAQQVVMYNLAAARYSVIGDVPNAAPDTIYSESGTEINQPPEAMLANCREVADPMNDAYAPIRDRLNDMAGFDVYEAVRPVAQRIDSSTDVINVVPRRWWKSA
ncbi:MAG: hypothetical protein DWQ08_12220, partial [Proteobacteria bacterium]